MARNWLWPWRPSNSNMTRRQEKAEASRKKYKQGTPSSFVKQIADQEGLCWYCFEEMGGDCTKEHLLARTLGGTNEAVNIKAAHGNCNSAAGHLQVEQKEALRRIGQELGRLAVIDAAHRMRRADAEYAFRPGPRGNNAPNAPKADPGPKYWARIGLKEKPSWW